MNQEEDIIKTSDVLTPVNKKTAEKQPLSNSMKVLLGVGFLACLGAVSGVYNYKDQSAPSSVATSDKKLHVASSIDEMGITISKKFFGKKPIDYIEHIDSAGLYAVVTGKLPKVYYVNEQLNTVISGDALLVEGDTPVRLTSEVMARFKKQGGELPVIDATTLLDGNIISVTPDSAKKRNVEKDLDAAMAATAKTTAAVTATLADVPVSAAFVGASTQSAGETISAAVSPQTDSSATPPAAKEQASDDDIKPSNPADLEKLAKGETLIPLREPTKEEEKKVIENTERSSAKALFGKVMKDEYVVVYNPPKDVKTVATINVFSDPECPSCKKLHKDLQKFLDLGIKVRYIAMPRFGLDSSIAKQMAVAFCSPNRAELFSSLYDGRRYDTNIENYEACFKLASENANLGYKLGVAHTPTIYASETGDSFVGYPSGPNAYLEVVNKLNISSLIGEKP
ncbi:thioredoxin fold domain-containing protein [Aeromonas veronii]|nr:thioredoxin fold domain-containing protein [Aeromonas veronii]